MLFAYLDLLGLSMHLGYQVCRLPTVNFNVVRASGAVWRFIVLHRPCPAKDELVQHADRVSALLTRA